MISPEKKADLSKRLEPVRQELSAIAAQQGGDAAALLQILREMESLHREICATYFYPTLPDRRRDLYNLLRDMEESGGWPYIARPKLRFILDGFLKSMELDASVNLEPTEDP